MFGTLSALEANDSREAVVRHSELGEVHRVFTSHSSRVSSHPGGLQYAEFHAKRSGNKFHVKSGAEAFEACPHETDHTVDFKLEVSAFSWITPPRCISSESSAYTSGLLLRWRTVELGVSGPVFVYSSILSVLFFRCR